MNAVTQASTVAEVLATSFVVDATPRQVFEAINDVPSWWTGDIQGESRRAGDEFVFRYKDIHRSWQRIVESIPGERVVWEVLDAHLSFARDPAEWKGTRMVFEIVPRGKRTELRFTHEGLSPECECFEQCVKGWTYYVGESLKNRVLAS